MYFLFSETLGRAFILLKTLSGSYTTIDEVRVPPHPYPCQGDMNSGREKTGMAWNKKRLGSVRSSFRTTDDEETLLSSLKRTGANKTKLIEK